LGFMGRAGFFHSIVVRRRRGESGGGPHALSKTLARITMRPANAERLGVRWLQHRFRVFRGLKQTRFRKSSRGLSALRRDWCLGSAGFRQEKLEEMENELGEQHAGALRRERGAAKAERWAGQELKRLGWTEAAWPPGAKATR